MLPLLLGIITTLLHHYYKGFYYHPFLHFSVSRELADIS